MLRGSHIKVWNLANPMKKQNKKHQNATYVDLLVKNWKLRVWCSFFHFIHLICEISNFDMWTAKHLAQASFTELTLIKKNVWFSANMLQHLLLNFILISEPFPLQITLIAIFAGVILVLFVTILCFKITLYFNFRTVSPPNNADCYFCWGYFGVISDYFGDFVPPAYMLLWQRWRQGVWYLHGQLSLGKQCNFEGKDNSRFR